MTSKRFVPLWILGNLVWLLAVPLLFGLWLSAEVEAHYRVGARTSGDADSLSLPVLGMAVANGALLLGVNVALGLFMIARRRIGLRRQRSQRHRRQPGAQ